MEIVETGNGTATVRLTGRDLTVLANAINETREALEEWEFSTRVGVDLAEAEDLRQRLKSLLDSVREGGP